MNQWLDGQVMTLRKKGSQYLKTRNIPTIVLSNRTLTENYHQAAEKSSLILQALRTRFIEISLSQPFTITFQEEGILQEPTPHEDLPPTTAVVEVEDEEDRSTEIVTTVRRTGSPISTIAHDEMFDLYDNM